MRSSRVIAAIAIAVGTVTAAAACSGGSSSSSTSASASTSATSATLTWWNDATSGSLRSVWRSVIKSFEASHPGVTIQNLPHQDEQFTTAIPLALQSDDPPDIYQQWGGGQEAAQIKSGKLTNLTASVSSWIGQLGHAVAGWQVNGQQYGIPYDMHVVGFWYRKDIFAAAGITSPPKTIDQLETDDKLLQKYGVTPIAIGSKDTAQAADWWEYFALRECPTQTIEKAMTLVTLSATCFSKASAVLTAFMSTTPFNATNVQQGPGSSASLVANGKAAMELQGDWDPSVIESLTANKDIASELGWFPFPTVPGGQGNPTTVLGGGDGFSCTTAAAEPACSEFLRYLDTAAVQQMIARAGAGLPANAAAVRAISQAERGAEATYRGAGFVATYFDVALPPQPGQNLDNAVSNYFTGQGTLPQIVASVNGPA